MSGPLVAAVIPAEGVSPRAGTQGQGPATLRAAPGPGYFAAAKFRDDIAGAVR